MRLKGTLVVSAAIAGFGVLGAASALASNVNRDRGYERGAVQPCSLNGVNPAYHPEIFGNAAVAAQYGFVQGPGGAWFVRPGCRR